MAEHTPMMKQYLEIKENNADCILFFRLGDFYEMFAEDAKIASKELDLTLTTRDRSKENDEDKIPMCGVPYHSSEAYIARLIAKGYKVAICEQLEDPALAKGLVKRDVIRVISPGTVIDSSMLEEGRNNYIGSVFSDSSGWGICFCDISTGEVWATGGGKDDRDKLINEAAAFCPSEIVFGGNAWAELMAGLQSRLGCRCENGDEERYLPEPAEKAVLEQFHKKSLDELGLMRYPSSVRAVGGLLSYLIETQKTDLSYIRKLSFYLGGQFMELDPTARRNLELTETLRSKDKKGSLLWVLDRTKTPMGGRLIRSWLEKPLLNPVDIKARSTAVSELAEKSIERQELILKLREISDMERLIGRIVYGSANCRDLVALSTAAACVPEIKAMLGAFKSAKLCETSAALDELEDIRSLIDRAIVDNPPFSVREGSIIRDGWSSEVDRYRSVLGGGRSAVAAIETQEREKTGIKSLKIGYNRVFGYYIEVSKSYYELVPEGYIRKQTLANNERYITQELKELEATILTAEERITALEYELFSEIRTTIAAAVERVQQTAHALAQADVLCSFAEVAAKNGYCMPEVDYSERLEITEGRHPVVEQMLEDRLFVPNDTQLLPGGVHIITGPNMAGKSTYMRQVGLIVLMAQVGSFVPAKRAHIGVVDRVFTRIGASDDLASGQSTFMVEMTEVADILKNATSKSLLILDEIGRGTSTFDGMAIARAVLEYAADKKRLGAKTLFATHYHELTVLEDSIPNVKNFNVAVKKRGDDIIFLRRIVPGGADDSYGIEVAKLAGVPQRVVDRARQVLGELESGQLAPRVKTTVEEEPQISMEYLGAVAAAQRLKLIDMNTITPIEALNILFELKKSV